MAYVLGIDIGTSFTAAAVGGVDDPKESRPQVLGLGSRNAAVPTVLFFGEDGQVLVGEAAERRGLDRPDLVVREFKRRIGDSVPIIAGEQSLAPEGLYARMARWVVDRAVERQAEPPAAIILTKPAAWGDYKSRLVREALADVGLSEVDLLTEPEAAALQYASQERLKAGSAVAVYDFGGGTFDVAIVRKRASQSFEVLGRPEGIERLGGADFDQAVFEHVVASVGDVLRTVDLTDPDALAALTRVRRECIEAKEALSYDSEASIPVILPGTQAHVRLVRSEFEAMIEASVAETIVALRHSLASAGCDADDLAAVLLVGGSSRVPLIAQMLSGELNRPIAIDIDPKASICLGAAVAAALAYAARQPTPAPLALAASDGANIPVADLPSVAKRHEPRPAARVTVVAAVVASLMVVSGTASHFAGLSLLSADASADLDQQTMQATDAPAGTAASAAPGRSTAPARTVVPQKNGVAAPGSGNGGEEPVPSPSPDLYEATGEEDASPPAPLSVEKVSDESGSDASSAEAARSTPTPHPTTAPTSRPGSPTSTPSPSTPPTTTTPTESPTSTPTPTPTDPVPTDPPATYPPPTQPPVTEPPATEPPATEPPATEPPATEPPATEQPDPEQPPATDVPSTDPLTTPAATDSPEAADAHVSDPEAIVQPAEG